MDSRLTSAKALQVFMALIRSRCLLCSGRNREGLGLPGWDLSRAKVREGLALLCHPGHWVLTASLPVSMDTICFSDPADLLCIFNKPRSTLSPKVDGNLFST
ncbi:mCG147232 [Mus musculus]|jgi:hypothetical protein|nr:mCG147232 [Mus musculus]